MLRPIFAVLPLDIRSLGYRARAAAWGSADAALGGVQRFSAATARRGVARVLRPVAALPGCVARAGVWQHLGCWQRVCAALLAAIFVRISPRGVFRVCLRSLARVCEGVWIF